MDEDIPAIVLDNGSGKIKAGFAGDDAPRSVFRTVIGRPHFSYPDVLWGPNLQDFYVGDEVQQKRGVLSLECPMERGIVTNWDDMETIWGYTFTKELRINPSEHPVLLTEVPLNPKENQEKMMMSMFETFNVPAAYVTLQAVLSCYASGRGTGIFLEAGEETTHVVPIYEGYTFPYAIQRNNFGGKDITEYLSRLLMKRGYYLTSSSELETVREMKEALCYVPQNYDKELTQAQCSSALDETYDMPDGSKLLLREERFKTGELLFDRYPMTGREGKGIHHLVSKCLDACDMDTRKDMYANIIVCGGNTMFPGFADRMKIELSKLFPSTMKTKVISPPERKLMAWIGGSILASLSTFQNMWITKEEYEEHGPGIVHRKCLV